MYNNPQLNSTMIEKQQQQMAQSQLPPMGLTSHLPPPTSYYEPFNPYMGYPQLYPMQAPLMVQPPSNYSLPPPTPHLLDISQQQQQPHQQQDHLDNNNKLRNISTSSFKHEEIELEARITHNEDVVEPKRERLTPLFHPRPHVKAIFGLNTIIQVKANDPCEGQPALVEIHNLYDLVEDYLTSDPNYKLLQEFPGPLIK